MTRHRIMTVLVTIVLVGVFALFLTDSAASSTVPLALLPKPAGVLNTTTTTLAPLTTITVRRWSPRSLAPATKVTSKPVPHTTVTAPFANDAIHTIIAGAALHWGVPIDKMDTIASCESKFDPHASNGSHGGLFQQANQYWAGRVAAYNQANPDNQVKTDIFDPMANAYVSARMMAQTGYGDWSQCL